MRPIQRDFKRTNQKKVRKSAPRLEEVYGQMDDWPREWRGDDDDIPYGEEIVAEMKPFVAYLIDEQELARKTISNNLEGLFLLGGEIIRRINTYAEDRKIPPRKLLDDSLDEEGGPLCRHAEDGEVLRNYDAACRKFYKFRISTNLTH